MKKSLFIIALIVVSNNFLSAQEAIVEIDGYLELKLSEDPTSIYIGENAGELVGTTRFRGNTFVGYNNGRYNTEGNENSFFGSGAGSSNTEGNENSFFGRITGGDNTLGDRNSFFGTGAGVLNQTGNRNTYIGAYAGANLKDQSNMIIIGANAGPTSNSVFADADDMRLYIDVEGSNTPLIYGEFDNDLIRINGRLQTKVTDGQKTYLGLFEGSGNSQFGYEWEYDGGNDKLHLWSRGFNNNNEAIRMTWLKNGNIGIGKVTPTVALDVVGAIAATGDISAATINGSSDINLKEHIVDIDSKAILAKITNLPISEWQYKTSPDRHIGPMAQDFYAAFGLGQGETTIATVDADGVALAAIQALAKENEELKKRLVRLEALLLKE